MPAIRDAVVGRAREGAARVEREIGRVGREGQVRGLETDREAEGFAAGLGFAEKIRGPRGVGARAVRVLRGIARDAGVFLRLVERLARAAGPAIKERRERLELFALELEADFSREAGEVAGSAQARGIGIVEHPPLEVAVLEVAAVAVFVEAGEDAHAAGHADGGGVVVIRETHAVAREAIEVRRVDVGVAGGADGARGLVIGEEEDDVRPRRGRGGGGQGEDAEGDEGADEFHGDERQAGAADKGERGGSLGR